MEANKTLELLENHPLTRQLKMQEAEKILAERLLAASQLREATETEEKIIPELAAEVFEKESELKRFDETRGEILEYLMERFGTLDKFMMQDYSEKNKEVRILRDRMVVRWLQIVQTSEPYREGIRGAEQPLSALSDEVFLSRIGFNEQQDTALFHVSQNGAPMTGYFVLMVKKENRWVIKNAVLEDLKIP